MSHILCLSCKNVVFVQISKCLGKSFQHNGHGVDAKDLAEKMQRLSTEVSESANKVFIFKSILLIFICIPSFAAHV